MLLKTPDQVKAELSRKGISIAKWAAANELSPLIAYQVLSGRHKGTRGEAHRAAVLLGIKDGEVVGPADVKGALDNSSTRRAA